MSEELRAEPTVVSPEPPDAHGSGDRIGRWLLLPLAVALIASILIFYVFFASAYVEGDSMAPTLHNGDRLLLTHGDSLPQRGDIVVARVIEPRGPVELVKRVVALPGDMVEVRQDVAYVNGQPEPDRGQLIMPQFSDSRPPYTVPAGHVFVLGDNRPDSVDSRYLGAIPISGIKGKAVFIFAPVTRLRGIP